MQFYEGGITDVWYVGEARKTEAADWEKSLMDFFVIIPAVRRQPGSALPGRLR